jgi:hypothetical protein
VRFEPCFLIYWSVGRSLRALGLVAVALATGSCSEPATSSEPTPILVNQVVEVDLPTSGDARFVFQPTADDQIVTILFQATSGSASLVVTQGTTEVVRRAESATDNALGRHPAGTVTTAGRQPLGLRLTGSGHVRLEIFQALASPEHRPAQFAIGDTVREPIDAAGDADEFVLSAATDDQIIIYAQADDSGSTGMLQLEVTGPGFGGAVIFSLPADGGFDTHHPGRLPIVPGEYRIRVSGSYIGPYHFLVRRIDPRPESLPAAAIQSDTMVGEKLDYVGDVDEFTLTGVPGDTYNVMIQLTSGDPDGLATVEIPDAPLPDTSIPGTSSSGVDSVLIDHATGRFMLPASGRATIRVSSSRATKGPYRLFVYRIDLRPEGPVRTLSETDSVLTERIELPGDVDEFNFVVGTNDTIAIGIVADPASPLATPDLIPLAADVVTANGTVISEATGPAGFPFAVQPGQYRIRVLSFFDRTAGYRGPYQLYVYRIRMGPEQAPSRLAIGDTVADAIDPSADLDLYSFAAAADDQIDVYLQVLDPIADGITANVTRARDEHDVASVSTLTPAPLDANHSGRSTIDESGDYHILVVTNNTKRGNHARYRLNVRRYPVTPEHHSGTIQLGDVVTDESIDQPGDVDEFILQGAAGAEYTIFFTANMGGPGLPGLSLDVLDGATKATIRTSESAAGNPVTVGPLVLPASGRVALRVSEHGGSINNASFFLTGSYRLDVRAIGPAPETVPPNGSESDGPGKR